MRHRWWGRSDYSSMREVESRVRPGVRFVVVKMTFGRRVELMTRVREIARRMEFEVAGQTAGDKMDACLAQAGIERLYVTWGVKAISGLVLDGHAATPELLADIGPEDLFR